MKSFVSKFLIGAFGLALAVTPLTASAAQWGVGIRVGGPGYSVRTRCYRCERPAPRYGWHRYGPRPALYDGYYGWAPGGYNGYYWRGRWFTHRRWGNGAWIYF